MKLSGDEIRAARERAHFTQQELAKMVGVSLRTIGNWERGESVPKSRMAALVEVLDVEPKPATAQKFPEGSLQYLIQDHKGDRSYAKLARDCGLTADSAGRNLARRATEPFTALPEPETITGLARGLRVPIIDVLRAAAVSVGIPVIHAPGDDLVIPQAGKLPQQARETLMLMAESLLDAYSHPWGDEPAVITDRNQSDHDLAAYEGHADVDPEEIEPTP